MRIARLFGIWCAINAVVCGCAPNDLGAPCHLLRADNSEAQPRPGHDIIQSGSGECEQFSCVSFEGQAATCSRPCVTQGEACEGNMVCRLAVLEPDLLAQVRARTEGRDDDHDGVDDFEALAAGLSESFFCGPAPL